MCFSGARQGGSSTRNPGLVVHSRSCLHFCSVGCELMSPVGRRVAESHTEKIVMVSFAIRIIGTSATLQAVKQSLRLQCRHFVCPRAFPVCDAPKVVEDVIGSVSLNLWTSDHQRTQDIESVLDGLVDLEVVALVVPQTPPVCSTSNLAEHQIA